MKGNDLKNGKNPMVEPFFIVNMLHSMKSKAAELEQRYSEKLSNLEDLKKSILQKAFAGELLN